MYGEKEGEEEEEEAKEKEEEKKRDEEEIEKQEEEEEEEKMYGAKIFQQPHGRKWTEGGKSYLKIEN